MRDFDLYPDYFLVTNPYSPPVFRVMPPMRMLGNKARALTFCTMTNGSLKNLLSDQAVVGRESSRFISLHPNIPRDSHRLGPRAENFQNRRSAHLLRLPP
jgi:hypothetical protein